MGSKEAGRNDVAVFDFEYSDRAYIVVLFPSYLICVYIRNNLLNLITQLMYNYNAFVIKF